MLRLSSALIFAAALLVGCDTPPAASTAADAPPTEDAHGADPHDHGSAAGAPLTQADGWTPYGASMDSERTVVPAATLLANPAAYVDQTLRVEGRVAEVCQKAGCWMVVAEGDQSIRVTMKDHAFSVDKQGAGSNCQVDGVLIAKALDPEEVAHFEGETKAGGLVPEKQAQGNVVYEIVADAVRMRPST